MLLPRGIQGVLAGTGQGMLKQKNKGDSNMKLAQNISVSRFRACQSVVCTGYPFMGLLLQIKSVYQ